MDYELRSRIYISIYQSIDRLIQQPLFLINGDGFDRWIDSLLYSLFIYITKSAFTDNDIEKTIIHPNSEMPKYDWYCE